MFKLIKLAIYGLLGYTIYQMYQGMQHGQSSGLGGDGSLRRREPGGSLTGPGEGMSESSLEATGMSSNHRVGRGVIAQ